MWSIEVSSEASEEEIDLHKRIYACGFGFSM